MFDTRSLIMNISYRHLQRDREGDINDKGKAKKRRPKKKKKTTKRKKQFIKAPSNERISFPPRLCLYECNQILIVTQPSHLLY